MTESLRKRTFPDEQFIHRNCTHSVIFCFQQAFSSLNCGSQVPRIRPLADTVHYINDFTY